MTSVLTAIALVLVLEGLVLALLPDRLDDILRAIAGLGRDRRRAIGLIAAALGVILLWVVR